MTKLKICNLIKIELKEILTLIKYWFKWENQLIIHCILFVEFNGFNLKIIKQNQ